MADFNERFPFVFPVPIPRPDPRKAIELGPEGDREFIPERGVGYPFMPHWYNSQNSGKRWEPQRIKETQSEKYSKGAIDPHTLMELLGVIAPAYTYGDSNIIPSDEMGFAPYRYKTQEH